MEHFKANKSNVKDLLKFSKYRIPPYQRPYSWEKDYIDNFWSYLTDESENYFLGTIVLNDEFLTEEWVKDIVDGQQRFITITILYSVIRDLFLFLGDSEKAKGIQSWYIAFTNDDMQDCWYRISLTSELKDFFEENIQKQKPRDIYEVNWSNKEQKRVLENYKFFLSSIKEDLDKKDDIASKISYLQSLRDKVGQLDIVYIEVSSEEDAYTFFETINATGMKLSTADVLKNLLFKKTPIKDKVKEKWDEVLENLKNQDSDFDITRFIRHYWLSKHDKVGDKKLYHAIKKSIDVDKEYKGDYNLFIDELIYNSLLYRQILYPNAIELDVLGRGLYRNLKNLRLLWVLQPNPLILSLLRKLKETDEFKIKEVFSLVEKIEHFTYVYNLVVNKSPSKLEKIYSKNAIRIAKAKNKDELKLSIQECEKDLKQYLPKEEEFKVNFREIRYSKESKDGLRYLFGKLNTNWNEIQIDHVNIEHIFPQNPDSTYSSQDAKEALPYINDIWNLILIWPKINRDASNKKIEDKLNSYENSALPMTKKLIEDIKLKWSKWTVDDIKNRTEELVVAAWKIFSF